MKLDSKGGAPDVGNAVVVRLFGGLGNLLFQYMAGRALAERHRVPLYCIADGMAVHGSKLDLLGIKPDYIRLPSSLVRRAETGRDRSWKDCVRSVFNLWQLRPVQEPHFHFWPGFFDLSPGCLLSGYWQSPKYFASLSRPLEHYIDMAPILAKLDERAKAEVATGCTVSVHIRRGDYLRQPHTLAHHGIIEADYYDRARRIMDALHKPDQYFVFSDDPDLARQALGHWSRTTFMEERPQEQDLALMTLCDHHIIANSSFSWWGAIFDVEDAGDVIAPRYWLSPAALKDNYVFDLFPDDWIIA